MTATTNVARRTRRRFAADRDGMAASEFALLLPVMVLVYFGSVELTQGFSASRKTDNLARDLADLAAQASTLASSDMTTIFAAASGVMYPFSGAQMTLSSVIFKTGSDTKVHAYTDWSSTSGGGTARPCTELPRTSASSLWYAVPDGLFSTGTTIIVADVTYLYKPIIGSTFLSIGTTGGWLGTGSLTQINLQHTSYMQPRNVSRVTYSGTTCNVSFP